MKDEFLVLQNYKEQLANAKNLKQQELEALIILLSNQIIDNNFSNDGPIASWILVLRHIQIKKELSEKEETMLHYAEQGKIMVYKLNYNKNKKIRKRLNFDKKPVK